LLLTAFLVFLDIVDKNVLQAVIAQNWMKINQTSEEKVISIHDLFDYITAEANIFIIHWRIYLLIIIMIVIIGVNLFFFSLPAPFLLFLCSSLSYTISGWNHFCLCRKDHIFCQISFRPHQLYVLGEDVLWLILKFIFWKQYHLDFHQTIQIVHSLSPKFPLIISIPTRILLKRKRKTLPELTMCSLLLS
jgi:hypothetical protein